MNKSTVRMADKTIREGYILEFDGAVGEMNYSIMIIPPMQEKNEYCPFLIFVSYYGENKKYNYVEEKKLPYINIDECNLKDINKVVKKCFKDRKKEL